jgi:hypothetical protein
MNRCLTCDGWGMVIRGLSIDSPGRPQIIPCPDCTPATTDVDMNPKVQP